MIVFIVLGRLGSNLTISKLAPICCIDKISQIYVFRESDGLRFNEKLKYITLPTFIIGIKPQFLSRIIRRFYEPLQLMYYSLKYRPSFINGFYLLPKGLYSFFISKLLNINCIISIIGGKEEVESELKIPKLWKIINLFILKHCKAVACKGQKDIDYLVAAGIKRNKIFLFNGGIDITRFRNSLDNRNFDIIFAGRFDANKGPFRVLEIVKSLVSDIKNLQCVLLGDGPLKKPLEYEINKLNLHNNIHCIGHVNNPERYFQLSKIFVLPSTNEGLSTAMLESMSCGCVPVVSNVGNTSEAVVNGVNGILIDQYDDIDFFVSYVLLLLRDNEKWSDYSRNAVMTIYNKYTFKSQSQLYEKIISDRM